MNKLFDSFFVSVNELKKSHPKDYLFIFPKKKKTPVKGNYYILLSIGIIHMKLITSELCCVWQDEARPFLPFPTEDGFHCNWFASNRVRNADKKSLLVQQMELATKCQDVKSIVNYARVVVSPVVALRAIEKQIHQFVNIR